MSTSNIETTKRPRGRPKGTTKADKDKGSTIWLPVRFKAAVLAYIELLRQQEEKQL